MKALIHHIANILIISVLNYAQVCQGGLRNIMNLVSSSYDYMRKVMSPKERKEINLEKRRQKKTSTSLAESQKIAVA